MKGFLDLMAGLFRRQPKEPPRIVVTGDGLQVTCGGVVTAHVRWSVVRKIITYKYDLLTTDTICVGFLTKKEADSWFEINENWEGFREAVQTMERMFPTITKDWFGEVMVPAFERKEKVLWEGIP